MIQQDVNDTFAKTQTTLEIEIAIRFVASGTCFRAKPRIPSFAFALGISLVDADYWTWPIDR